ncbi:hypothetical protein ZWY2020_013185 [Hordeum vulgare]|nr:hypothetical protein ZWY2020_013185 [Hordeum vulgare]
MTQVHNYIRKLRNRWTRIVYLQSLIGALWDHDKKVIMLEEQHYLGHTQDHPTDAEFLNTPLEHYNYMQLCFVNKLAAGSYAMATRVPLGKPIVVEAKDKSKVMEGQGTIDEVFEHVPSGSNFLLPTASATQAPSPTSTKKRNRTSVLTEEDSV